MAARGQMEGQLVDPDGQELGHVWIWVFACVLSVWKALRGCHVILCIWVCFVPCVLFCVAKKTGHPVSLNLRTMLSALLQNAWSCQGAFLHLRAGGYGGEFLLPLQDGVIPG